MHRKETFESLYCQLISELSDMERQIIDALPRVIRAASSKELKATLELHLAETEEQAARLDAIVGAMPHPPEMAFSDPMRALLAKAMLLIARHQPSPVLDCGLIDCALKVERHEIAAYGSARLLARMLGRDQDAVLLLRTLKEERETASTLAQLEESVIMGEALEEAVLDKAVAA